MTRVVVTGAAGFIGSNLIKGLNALGIDNIIAVDDLRQSEKFTNLVDLQIADYVDLADFYEQFAQGAYGQVEAVFHQGASTDPTALDGRQMMASNYTYSVSLFQTCQKRGIRLIYASSAAVYGQAVAAPETPAFERPQNLYGYSKLLFDQRMRRECGADFARTLSGRFSQVVGLRYFNVYGPREQHLAQRASLVWQHLCQNQASGPTGLTSSFEDAEHDKLLGDWVYVDDIVSVNLWFFDRPAHSGIFNVGTGQALPCQEVARTVADAVQEEKSRRKATPTRATPPDVSEHLAASATTAHLAGPIYPQANIAALRAAGYQQTFQDLHSGVRRYVKALSDAP